MARFEAGERVPKLDGHGEKRPYMAPACTASEIDAVVRGNRGSLIDTGVNHTASQPT